MTKGVVKVLVAKGGDLFQQKGGYLSVKRESVEEGEEIGLSRDVTSVYVQLAVRRGPKEQAWRAE